MPESIVSDAFLRERSAGAGTALRVLSVSSNLAVRRHGENYWVHTPLLCSNARRLDLPVQYLIGRGAQTPAHMIAAELNFPQNSVSAELR